MGAIVTVFGGSCNTEKQVMLNHCISNKNGLYCCNIIVVVIVSNIICYLFIYILYLSPAVFDYTDWT